MKTENTTRVEYIDVLRAVACALITNSHFHGVYPIDIAFGGCPGNCLFFLVSGFLFARKDLKNTHFVPWYSRKLLRLHIPLTITYAISVLTGYEKVNVLMFLIPIIYNKWFITAIAILYAMCFIIHKYLSNYRLLFIGADILIYAVLYFCVFDTSVFFVERRLVFLVLYGYIVMEIGWYIYIYGLQRVSEKTLSASCFGIAIVSLTAFLGMKLLISSGSEMALQLQFLTQIFSISFAASFFVVVSGLEKEIMSFLERIKLKKFLMTVGKSTLEIYLVQFFIISKFIAIRFPINFLLICTSIVMAGWCVNQISEKSYDAIIRLLNKQLRKSER